MLLQSILAPSLTPYVTVKMTFFMVTDARVTVVSCGLAAVLTSDVTARFSDRSDDVKVTLVSEEKQS